MGLSFLGFVLNIPMVLCRENLSKSRKETSEYQEKTWQKGFKDQQSSLKLRRRSRSLEVKDICTFAISLAPSSAFVHMQMHMRDEKLFSSGLASLLFVISQQHDVRCQDLSWIWPNSPKLGKYMDASQVKFFHWIQKSVKLCHSYSFSSCCPAFSSYWNEMQYGTADLGSAPTQQYSVLIHISDLQGDFSCWTLPCFSPRTPFWLSGPNKALKTFFLGLHSW